MIVRVIVNAENAQEELQRINFEIKDAIIGVGKNHTTVSLKGSRKTDVVVILLKTIDLNRNYAFRIPANKIMYVLSNLRGISAIEYDTESREISVISSED